MPEFTDMEAFAKANGFSSSSEMFRLTATADISTPEKLARFKKWQEEDGTKAGLLSLSDTTQEA